MEGYWGNNTNFNDKKFLMIPRTFCHDPFVESRIKK